MLSIEDLRQALDRPDLTDDEVGEIRDFLYWLAGALIDDYLAEQRHPRRRRQK